MADKSVPVDNLTAAGTATFVESLMHPAGPNVALVKAYASYIRFTRDYPMTPEGAEILLRAQNAAWAQLEQDDPEAVAQFRKENKIWDHTLGDGLDN